MNAKPLNDGRLILTSAASGTVASETGLGFDEQIVEHDAEQLPCVSCQVTDRRAFAEKLVGAEWAEWYCMSPDARFAASQKLWSEYLALGGSLDPEVDFQSPFYTADEYRDFAKISQSKDSQ
jgi:hypothetical protein